MGGVMAFVDALFAAYDRRDERACREMLHPEFRYVSKLTPALGLDAVSGRDATIELFFSHLPETFSEFGLEHFDTAELGPDQMMCGVRYHGRGRHSGAVVEQTFWKVFTLEGGRLLSMVEYDSAAEASAAADASAPARS